MTESDNGPNRGDIPSFDDDEDNELTSGDGIHSGDGPDTDDRYTTNKPQRVVPQDDTNMLPVNNVNSFNSTITNPTDSWNAAGDSTTTTSTTTTTVAAATTTKTTTTTTTAEATAATQPSTTAQPSTTTESPTSAPPLSPTQSFVDQGTSNTVIIFYFFLHTARISYRLDHVMFIIRHDIKK